MICPRCKDIIDQKDKYCPHCGYALKDIEKNKTITLIISIIVGFIVLFFVEIGYNIYYKQADTKPFTGIFTHSNNKVTMKLLAKFPKAGYYYYYSPNFDVKNFSKPAEITQSEEGNYTIFVYDKEIPADKFLYYDNGDYEKIDDDGSQMFSFIINGINAKPTYYVYRSPNYNSGEVIRTICEISPNNLQKEYIYEPITRKFVKQAEYNNGELNLRSICNPNYNPNDDV